MIIVTLRSIKNATTREKSIFQDACVLLQTILNGDLFRSKVLTAHFTETHGYTNEEIYNKIVSGSTIIHPDLDNEMTFDIRIYYSWWSRVIGYVNNGSEVIHVNRKYISNSKYAGSNMLHEMVHNCGFSHYIKPWVYSVPYTINKIFEECAEAYGKLG